MRVLDPGVLKCSSSRTECPWRYGLLVEDVEVDGFHCESYGLLVADDAAGQEAVCRHVTVNAGNAVELLDKLRRCQVSPAHLADVVEDWLGR